jgi:hypothetical protein
MSSPEKAKLCRDLDPHCRQPLLRRRRRFIRAMLARAGPREWTCCISPAAPAWPTWPTAPAPAPSLPRPPGGTLHGNFSHHLEILTANPSRLPQGVVDELREREAPDGVIKFDTKRRRRFGPGAKVCIKHGVMVGFSGIVERLQSRDRVTVLFDLLGRKTSVLLRETELTAA